MIALSNFEENVLKLLSEMNQRQKDFQLEVNNRFDDVDKRFAEVDKRFADVNKQFAEVNKRFDKIESDIKEIKEERSFIKRAEMETDESVKFLLENLRSIYEMLGEHEVSIRTLRRKLV